MKTKVRDVMTRNPLCCMVFDHVASVAAEMNDYRTFVLPVTEKHGKSKLLGIITPWNLCMKVVAAGRDPQHVEAGECLASQLAFCKEIDPVRVAIEKLTETRLPGIPVVNDAFEVVGTISIGDLIQHEAIGDNELLDWVKNVFTAGQMGMPAENVA
jgi:CBS domain-containing protein